MHRGSVEQARDIGSHDRADAEVAKRGQDGAVEVSRASGDFGSTRSTMHGSLRGLTRRAWTSPARSVSPSRSCAPCSPAPAVGRPGRARQRRPRQHRQEPAPACCPEPRPCGAGTPRRGTGPTPGRTPVTGRNHTAAAAVQGAAFRNPQPEVGRDWGLARGRCERALKTSRPDRA